MNKKYFVYVLKSQKDKGLYIGMTSNVKDRLKRHNAGWERTTRCRIPFDLIYSEIFDTRIEARSREKYFKSGAGRELIKYSLVNCSIDV